MEQKISTGLYSKAPVLELDNIKKLTQSFNNPQDNLKFIHVAGTNGKGSVCSFLQNTLTLAGFKVGKYSSPDIMEEFDSISINNQNITREKILNLCDSIRKRAEGFSPSDFEVLTTAAFLYFSENKCDYVILETGLGGEGDATNIIGTPLYSVITKISYDHTNYLGKDLKQIAQRKAGIIKNNGKTVTTEQKTEVMEVIVEKCRQMSNSLILSEAPQMLPPHGMHEHFRYKGLDIRSGLSGLYQVQNAVLAAEVLLDLKINKKIIEEGIKSSKNHARFELISENPTIIFDGAHNPDGFEALLSSLLRYYPNMEKNFVIGMMRDKDIAQTAALLKKYGEDRLSRILTVRVSGNPRSEEPETLQKLFEAEGLNVICADTLKNALSLIGDKLTVICGSLYMYREIPFI